MSTNAEVKFNFIGSVSLAGVCVSFLNFAMHDSNLGVNTWLASDNSTQRYAINSTTESETTTTEKPVIAMALTLRHDC